MFSRLKEYFMGVYRSYGCLLAKHFCGEVASNTYLASRKDMFKKVMVLFLLALPQVNLLVQIQ